MSPEWPPLLSTLWSCGNSPWQLFFFAWLTRHPSPFEIQVPYSSFLPVFPNTIFSLDRPCASDLQSKLSPHCTWLSPADVTTSWHCTRLTYLLCVFHNNGPSTFLKCIGHHFLFVILSLATSASVQVLGIKFSVLHVPINWWATETERLVNTDGKNQWSDGHFNKLLRLAHLIAQLPAGEPSSRTLAYSVSTLRSKSIFFPFSHLCECLLLTFLTFQRYY